jgi:hypothetical protein
MLVFYSMLTSPRLITQLCVIQHRSFQRRAGRQTLDFAGEPCLEGLVVGRAGGQTTDGLEGAVAQAVSESVAITRSGSARFEHPVLCIGSLLRDLSSASRAFAASAAAPALRPAAKIAAVAMTTATMRRSANQPVTCSPR